MYHVRFAKLVDINKIFDKYGAFDLDLSCEQKIIIIEDEYLIGFSKISIRGEVIKLDEFKLESNEWQLTDFFLKSIVYLLKAENKDIILKNPIEGFTQERLGNYYLKLTRSCNG